MHNAHAADTEAFHMWLLIKLLSISGTFNEQHVEAAMIKDSGKLEEKFEKYGCSERRQP